MKKNRSRMLGLFLSVCLLLGMLSSAGAAQYYVGDTMDDFTLTTVDGETVSLSSLLSTHDAVVLNFWYIACPWCVYEFPFLEEAWQQYQGDVAVLAVNPVDSADDMIAFREENNLSFPMAQDSANLSALFGVTGYPTTVIIDRFGVYCYGEAGAVPSADAFKSLFETYTADDYTESYLYGGVTAPKPTAEMPDPQLVSQALTTQPDVFSFFALNDNGAWPWLLNEQDGRSYAYAGNSKVNGTAAYLCAHFAAQEGDVLSFDLRVSSEAAGDYFLVQLDNEVMLVRSGEHDWQSHAVSLSAGEHMVAFVYLKNATAYLGEDMAQLDNITLLSGEEAAAALANNPVYPHTLEGSDVSVSFDNVSEVVITDPSGMFDSYYDASGCYELYDNACARVYLGTDLDPHAALVSDHAAGTIQPLSSYSHDETSFIIPLDYPSDGWSGLILYPSILMETTPQVYLYFSDTEALDAFCQTQIPTYAGTPAEGVTWAYATEEDSIDPTVPVTYTMHFFDTDGAPVAGVVANICDETTCTPMFSDENGCITFEKLPYPYEVHIIKVPDGYEFDMSQGYTLPEGGCDITFFLDKK